MSLYEPFQILHSQPQSQEIQQLGAVAYLCNRMDDQQHKIYDILVLLEQFIGMMEKLDQREVAKQQTDNNPLLKGATNTIA